MYFNTIASCILIPLYHQSILIPLYLQTLFLMSSTCVVWCQFTKERVVTPQNLVVTDMRNAEVPCMAPKYFLLSFNGTPHPLGCTSQLDRASCSGLVVCFSKNFSSCARTAMQGFWNNTVTLHVSMLCACTVYGFSGDKHVITPCSCNIWYTRTKPEGRTRKGVITYTYTITSSAIIITIIIIALVTVMKLHICMHFVCILMTNSA